MSFKVPVRRSCIRMKVAFVSVHPSFPHRTPRGKKNVYYLFFRCEACEACERGRLKKTIEKEIIAKYKSTNQYSCFRRVGLKASVVRIEIYETISHVSTNQVWLHINFPSSRIFQFLALLRFAG